MKQCPKCSSQCGDDQTICRTCGAIFEAIAGQLPPDAGDAISFKHDAWTCSQCGQSVPNGFDVCWNCGTSQDGVPDPDFRKESANEHARKWHPSDRSSTAQQTGTPCPKCGSSKIIPNARILDQGHPLHGDLQVMVDADPGALIFKDRLYDQLTADICGDCGHIELNVQNPGELYEHYLRSTNES